MIATSTHTVERSTITLQAPSLATAVDTLLALHEDPLNARARITAALLAKEGLDRCPRCHDALSVEGYRETRTPGLTRRTIDCGGCQTRFVVQEALEA